MNPYSRFQIVSGAVSGALVLAGFGFLAKDVISEPLTMQSGFAFAGLITAAVLIWYTINHQFMPIVFENGGLRSRVLGQHNIEGTWLQAERSATGARISVIGIRPGRDGFTLNGYAMDEDLEVVSNMALDHSKLEWPYMSFKFRNTLVDAEDPAREGFGELQFELGSHRPVRFNGFCKLTGSGERYSIEGVRLTDADDLDLLESLEGREELVDRYWELFFERDVRRKERKTERKARREARRNKSQTQDDALELTQNVSVGPAGELKSRVEAAFQAEEQDVNKADLEKRAS